jgi:hypothetical protein
VLREAFTSSQAFARHEADPRPTAEDFSSGQESVGPEPGGQAEPVSLQDSLNGQSPAGPEPGGQAEPVSLQDSLNGQAPVGPEPVEGGPGADPA